MALPWYEAPLKPRPMTCGHQLRMLAIELIGLQSSTNSPAIDFFASSSDIAFGLIVPAHLRRLPKVGLRIPHYGYVLADLQSAASLFVSGFQVRRRVPPGFAASVPAGKLAVADRSTGWGTAITRSSVSRCGGARLAIEYRGGESRGKLPVVGIAGHIRRQIDGLGNQSFQGKIDQTSIRIGRALAVNTLCCLIAVLLAWNAPAAIHAYPFIRDFCIEMLDCSRIGW